MIFSKDTKTNKYFCHNSQYDFETFIEKYENPNNIIIIHDEDTEIK